MHFVSVPASGLEIRNPVKNGQEKNEKFIFSREEKFLDSKKEPRLRGKIKK
jgi:hypothetical protein